MSFQDALSAHQNGCGDGIGISLSSDPVAYNKAGEPLYLIGVDIDKVQASKEKFDAAKIEYDKAVTKNASLATTPDGVYLKAVIYDGLAKDSLLSKKFPTAFDIMNSSIEEYMKMDTSFKSI